MSGSTATKGNGQSASLFVKRCLIGAGISFVGTAAICILLYPEVFQHYEYGVSYFGSVSSTYIPYYFGFGITIILTALIGWRLRLIKKSLSMFFYAFAACMTGVAVTSYSLNHTVYATHWGFAIALTICILATIWWLIKQGGLARFDYILIVLIVTTVIISALPIVHSIPGVRVYIPRELIVFVCSLWLLGRAALKASA
ncbi:MAG TPA: hypothetical protein VK674_03600 [Candidatus Limnocylindria bacterium]|nr:hypothetical protein [Candidatus Limnocylindria bacterium]